MTWNELNKRLVAALTDDYSEVLEGEERDEWLKNRQAYEKHKAELARKEAETMDTWFEQEEYVNGSWWKRLWLRLVYAIRDTHGEKEIPNHIIKEMARCLLPDIIAYCESEEGKAAFLKWKAEQKQAKLTTTEQIEKSKAD